LEAAATRHLKGHRAYDDYESADKVTFDIVQAASVQDWAYTPLPERRP